jgi:hypothetical protein
MGTGSRMPTTNVVRTLATAAGRTLASGLGAVAAVTRRKPLHAKGRTYRATLRIDAPLAESQVPLLARPGVHHCIVRLSRAMSTPEGFWDIGGLALRIESAGPDDGPADLLFANTGTGRLSRHVLRLTRQPLQEPMTTLLPVRAGGSTLLLLVHPDDSSESTVHAGSSTDRHPVGFTLSAGLGDADWQRVGLVELAEEMEGASPRFDPLVRRLDGTVPPTWVTAMREPAYRVARRLGRHTA